MSIGVSISYENGEVHYICRECGDSQSELLDPEIRVKILVCEQCGYEDVVDVKRLITSTGGKSNVSRI